MSSLTTWSFVAFFVIHRIETVEIICRQSFHERLSYYFVGVVYKYTLKDYPRTSMLLEVPFPFVWSLSVSPMLFPSERNQQNEDLFRASYRIFRELPLACHFVLLFRRERNASCGNPTPCIVKKNDCSEER